MKNLNSYASVIIPTYNRAEFITKSLDSVWAQTYRPIEVLVIDDGSTDSTREVVEHWIDNHGSDNFTSKYVYQKKSGAPTARNTGIEHATGRYLQFSDSDDTLEPEKLELQIAKMRVENTPICICDYIHVNEREEFLLYKSNNRSIEDILSSPLGLSTIIGVIDRTKFKKDILKWNPKLKKFQDRDFYHKLFFIIDDFSYVDKPLFKWIRHKEERIFDSSSHSSELYSASLKSLLLFHFKNRSKIQDYKKPYIRKLYKKLFLKSAYGKALLSVLIIIPKQLKIWHYFR